MGHAVETPAFRGLIAITCVLLGCGGGGGGVPEPADSAQYDTVEDSGVSDGGCTDCSALEVVWEGSIGPDGGTIALDEFELAFPPDAVTTATTVRISRVVDSSLLAQGRLSDTYVFEPAGISFGVLPTIRWSPPDGAGPSADIYWSLPGADAVFARRGAQLLDGRLAATVQHFSAAFVGDAGVYTSPPDLTCLRTEIIDWLREPRFGAVSFLARVTDCHGIPVPGLAANTSTAAGGGEFALYEDDHQLSVESGGFAARTHDLPLHLFFALVIDLSESTLAHGEEVTMAAVELVTKLRERSDGLIHVGVIPFAGDASLGWAIRPSLDLTDVGAKLQDLVMDFRPLNRSSTNLAGAMARAKELTEAAARDFEERQAEGAVAEVAYLLFTDGRDTAGFGGEAPTQNVWVIGLDSPDLDVSALEALATNGLVVTPNPELLHREFGAIAAAVERFVTSAVYRFAYCSPSQSGSHELRLEVATAPTGDWDSFSFEASAAVASDYCTAEYLDEICADQQCGGFWCGACDERVARCDADTRKCVDFCLDQNLCRGETITNPLGYSQVCATGPRRLACDDGSCVDAMDPGRGLVAGTCTCAGSNEDCDGDLRNGCESGPTVSQNTQVVDGDFGQSYGGCLVLANGEVWCDGIYKSWGAFTANGRLRGVNDARDVVVDDDDWICVRREHSIQCVGGGSDKRTLYDLPNSSGVTEMVGTQEVCGIRATGDIICWLTFPPQLTPALLTVGKVEGLRRGHAFVTARAIEHDRAYRANPRGVNQPIDVITTPPDTRDFVGYGVGDDATVCVIDGQGLVRCALYPDDPAVDDSGSPSYGEGLNANLELGALTFNDEMFRYPFVLTEDGEVRDMDMTPVLTFPPRVRHLVRNLAVVEPLPEPWQCGRGERPNAWLDRVGRFTSVRPPVEPLDANSLSWRCDHDYFGVMGCPQVLDPRGTGWLPSYCGPFAVSAVSYPSSALGWQRLEGAYAAQKTRCFVCGAGDESCFGPSDASCTPRNLCAEMSFCFAGSGCARACPDGTNQVGTDAPFHELCSVGEICDLELGDGGDTGMCVAE